MRNCDMVSAVEPDLVMTSTRVLRGSASSSARPRTSGSTLSSTTSSAGTFFLRKGRGPLTAAASAKGPGAEEERVDVVEHHKLRRYFLLAEGAGAVDGGVERKGPERRAADAEHEHGRSEEHTSELQSQSN